MLQDVIKTSSLTIKKVTNVRTIVGTMNDSEIYEGMLQEVDKLSNISCHYFYSRALILFPSSHKNILEKYYDKLQVEQFVFTVCAPRYNRFT